MRRYWIVVAAMCGVMLAGCVGSGSEAGSGSEMTVASVQADVPEWEGVTELRESRYQNGRVKESWRVRVTTAEDGGSEEVRHGPVTWYFADGLLDREGFYTDGKESGIWTYWWDDGSLKGRGPYVGGVKEGLWTFWDELGGRTVGEFRDDKRHGVWRTFDADGLERARVEFDLNVPSGDWYAFDTSGAVIQLTHYEDGVRHGPYFEWWPDGTARTAGTFEQGSKNGLFREWWQDGSPKTLGHWEGDLKSGTWKTWYPTGGPENWETLGVYVGGDRHGYWVTKQDEVETFGVKVVLPGGKPFPFPEAWMVRWWGEDESLWPVKRPPDDVTEELREQMEKDPDFREAIERAAEREG